jgi:3-oxoacyl-[acyl-carrier protein] reductase
MVELDLTGHVTLVTGASGHIGAGIARRFAEAGAAVVAHYHRNAAAAEELVEDLSTSGGKAIAAGADLTDEQQVHDLIDTATSLTGRLDSLVNNAGIQPLQPLETMSLTDWRAVIDATMTSVFTCTQAAVEAMRESGGSITHISSIEGSQPARAHAHYCSAKAGVLMHARSAALEYGPLGLRVNAVSPGLIERPGLAEQWPEGVRRWNEAAPLTRLGHPTDVANACLFLASPLASWITGQNLTVDGGVTAHPTW